MTSADETSVGAAPGWAAESSAPTAPASAAPPRRRLFRKYALLFIGLVGAALLVNSGFDFWFSYQENQAALIRVQQEKAEAAAQRIEEFVDEIKSQIGWTTHAQWSAGPLDQRRQDYFRLLRQVPAITELTQLSNEGRECLTVSRLKMDVIHLECDGPDWSKNPGFIGAKAQRVWFSPVYFRKQSEPYLTLAMAREGRNAGVTIAEINLKLIYDVITALRIGQGGYAYVVDGHGKLLAHPDISLVLRDTDLVTLPQVAAALASNTLSATGGTGRARTPSADSPAVSVAQNIAGRAVLTAHAGIPQLGWLVFVEVPLQEAFAPLYGAAWRTAILLALGLVAAALAALLLARRMTGPIRAIAEGAERLGGGDLSGRIDIHTGDELEGLAQQFNRMAADLQKSYAELEQRVRDRTAELSEALDQQTATAEVLGVINASPGDLAPVFAAMLEKATSLCGAAFGIMNIFDGERFNTVALHGVPQPLQELLLSTQPQPGAHSGPGRMLSGEDTVRWEDLAATPGYRSGDVRTCALVDLGGVRSYMAAALRKDGRLLGTLAAYRQEVRPFSDKQIALLQNFAAQAVIAMENARLITETREALEQQTATAEVLGVINSSPGDLAPVFNAMLGKAIHLCGAKFGTLWTYDGANMHAAAVLGAAPRYVEFLRAGPHPPSPIAHQPLLRGARVIHIADVSAHEGYRAGLALPNALVELGGVRTLLAVPLRKDGALLGVFSIYRDEVRTFEDKQIALLENFAAQAVIAMENARLITETREALEQQTATAEVLGVINSSPGDLAPVFDAMLEKAMRLCEASFGYLNTYDGTRFRTIATLGVPAQFAEFRQSNPPEYGPGTTSARILAGERVISVPDLMAEEIYRAGEPNRRAIVDLGGARSALAVALAQDDKILGTLMIYRQELRPFSDKQIALLQNFAAQAVIAMENARLITETREALEQQTATAEVLGVINSSPGDLAPVFDAILEKAHSLCGAAHGHLSIYDGQQFRAVATRGLSERFADLIRQGFRPAPTNPIRRLIGGERLVHIPDIGAIEDLTLRAAAELAGMRTVLFVPLRKDDAFLGMVVSARQEVRPFTDKQIALLQNFAAQAVIAMENARLITETREALEQQTATAEVLGVINSSPGDLAPVFDAMLEKATRLCEAAFAILWRFDGELARPEALYRVPPAWAEFWKDPKRPHPNSGPGLMMRGGGTEAIADMTQHGPYLAGEPMARAIVDLAGARSLVITPLRKDGAALGAITIYRQEVRPFSDKQIALLENFAAQAVIAMENARLITETREALEQQTATAEVLGVINASPGDLAPVFDAMLDKAIRLCQAAYGHLLTYDGECFHRVSVRGEQRYVEWREGPIRPAPIAPLGRISRGERIVHIADIWEEEVYRTVESFREMADMRGSRSQITVALCKEDVLLGAMVVYRQEVRPFSDKQVALLQNFAAQAVIAMENGRLITETREALEQQTATAEVLGVINASPGDLAPVFEAMLDKATRLCGAAFGVLWTYEGENSHAAAMHGVPAAFAEVLTRGPYPISSDNALGILLRGHAVVHLEDAADTEAYRSGDLLRRAMVDLGGARTMLAVPLRKDHAVLGIFVIYRQEVRPFSDKQITLLQNFAAQAVIAIENTRLINETREALEQQTATAEVLGVINASPGDLAPVFDALLDKATALCQASFGLLARFDGERYHAAALHGVPTAFAESWNEPRLPAPGMALYRLVHGEDVIHVEDVTTEDVYRSGNPYRRALGDLGGARTALWVALRKDRTLLGAFVIYRQEVRLFSPKQVELLRTFADQAVIAIDNARLLNELRDRTRDLQESLEYQTATSDVLSVISQSTFDLEPVLQTVAETAARLCDSEMAFILRRDGEVYRAAAALGWSPEYRAYLENHPIVPDRGTLTGRVVHERRAIQVSDIAADPEYTLNEAITLGKARTQLGVPLLREGLPIGVIILSRQRVQPFTGKQIELLTTFADQAVIAIENARLLNELRERTDELARSVKELKALSEVGQEVSSTLDLAAVLSTILNRSVALSGADAGAIFRYSEGQQVFRLAEAVGWDEALVNRVRELRIAEHETGMGEATRTRRPLQLADLVSRPSYPLRDATLAAGFHSVLIVPLVGAERVFGAIVLERRSAGEFPEAAVRLMQTLASQSVLAIQNARLFREIADKSEELRLASQHKSQFLANMSHELRTPLNAILGYTELMVDGIYGDLPQKSAGVLERVQNNGKHLLALINDVLDLSKIEAGQLVLTLEEYALPDVVQSVVTATEGLASTKGLRMNAEVAPGLPTGRGDARRLSQVLLNLVGNAVKFTDEGEVAIGARAENGHFVLTVRDTGPGIAPEDQGKIFEEFQQVDSSNTRKKGGTGLGLAISKRMVEMQGGSISVESELGHGATFRVSLPIRVEEVAEELMGAA